MRKISFTKVIVGLAICVALAGCPFNSKNVPDVVGKAQAAASSAIVGAGFVVGTITQEFSATVASGTVISQTPAAGATVSPGSAVDLVLSKGPQPAMVPSLAGQTQVAASSAIVGAGFVVGTVAQEFSATVASGTVISQTPAAGATVSPNSAVDLVLSRGPQPVAVPGVVGQTQASASSAIVGAGLVVGTITQDFSATVPSGTVISQMPAAGASVSPNSAVDLVLSKGPEPPATVPSVTGQTQAAVSSAIMGAGLVVGTVTQAYSATVPLGCVISQAPPAGASVSPGSAVDLVVSQGPQSVSVPDVVGMTQTAAGTALTNALLAVGAVTKLYSPTVPAGQVMNQDPAAGTNAAVGTSVDLGVSTGPFGVTVEILQVPAGTFTMGNSGVGDDALYAANSEKPSHWVTLSAYLIGKYDVTNGQYCAVLNWALSQGYLMTDAGSLWIGVGDIYAGDVRQILLGYSWPDCNITYSNGAFSPKSRTGLPGETVYSMETHPVVDVSWYGAAAFCNWLSEMRGLTPCYDMTANNWPLTVAPPTPGGYRLPTEAEWERAAAWDGAKHWTYGFTSDVFTQSDRCDSIIDPDGACISSNPLGLLSYPFTCPVGWFNGVNMNPNGGAATVNSVSPVGAYDMSGNVWQWCSDFWGPYSAAAQTNPVGPAPNEWHAIRGGSWQEAFGRCRSAARSSGPSEVANSCYVGFRVAKS